MEENPQIGERCGSAPLELRVWLTPKAGPFPVCFTTSNLVVLRQRVWAEIEWNPQNWGALGPGRPLRWR